MASVASFIHAVQGDAQNKLEVCNIILVTSFYTKVAFSGRSLNYNVLVSQRTVSIFFGYPFIFMNRIFLALKRFFNDLKDCGTSCIEYYFFRKQKCFNNLTNLNSYDWHRPLAKIHCYLRLIHQGLKFCFNDHIVYFPYLSPFRACMRSA